MEYGNTEWFEVRKGVRQGCILSPYLFNLYSEYILRRVGFEEDKGIKVGGRTINNLRYADNTTILAEDKKDLKKLLKKIKEESEKAGLMLNIKKTKIMTSRTLNKFILNGTEIEIINSYTFLGTIITRDGCDHKEINVRLSMGRLAMIKLEKLMKDREVMVATKIKIAETIIFPIVTYRSESWTVRKKDSKKITRSNNHPIKVTLFRSRNESKRVTGTGCYAWTSYRTQETRETTVVMA
jgi:hypothetical protein